MKDQNLAFYGFSIDAAKKSRVINGILNRLIKGVERDIEIVTSTPVSGRRMEISFSKHYNFHITVDYDSGYMSHHQESNSDSSSEHLGESIPNPLSTRPIYLSEDALLEKPEVSVKSKNVEIEHNADEKTIKLSADFGRDNSVESRNLFPSPDTVLSTSVLSQRTTFSGFDDSDSNTSLEIPCSKQIIIENVDYAVSDNNLHCSDINCHLNISDTVSLISQRNAQFHNCIQSESGQNYSCEYGNNITSFSQRTDQYEEDENCSALKNITNTSNTKNNEKKRLTLIFSKNDKENVYSVKRKYQSISPVKHFSPQRNDISLDKSITVEKSSTPNLVMENETEENDLTCSDNPENSINFDKDSVIEKTHVNIENELKEASNFDNSESPKKELILRKELDLEKIVLEQEDSEYCPVFVSPEKKGFNEPKQQLLEQIQSDQQKPPFINTPTKKFENPVDPNISPDLFEHDDLPYEATKELPPLNYIAEEKYIIKKDQRILKRAQNSLKGVLPPHSVTVVQLSVDEMLNRLETNKQYFWVNDRVGGKFNTETNNDQLNTSNDSNCEGQSKSLLLTGNKDCVDLDFPQILQQRYHGLHHNRSKLSEEFEELCLKYGQRYVGAETQSTCTVFETNFISPTKRKQTKQRWAVKSPGRRLSHLARRRITFSSANLQGGPSSLMGSRARQILVDAKKLDLLNRRRSPRKSPRKNLRRTPRKTPSKSPRLKSRTPSSSAKKKLAMRFRELAGEIEKTVPTTSLDKAVFSSKRALFRSPDHDKKLSFFQPSTSGLSTFENELKKPGTKRALFISPSKRSPLKNSPFKRTPFKRRLDLGVERKRKRTDCDDAPPSKLARSVSVDIRPSESEVGTKFSRAKSEMSISLNKSQAGPSGELSAVHKKKLQWAVYEALRSQDITPNHPQFKIFASVLARVTRRFLPILTSSGPKECGTTEKMLRIARFHVYAVIKGKSVDEIISEHLRSRAKNAKPQGYIGPGDLNEKKSSEVSSKESSARAQFNTRESVDRKKVEQQVKPKIGTENRIDRIRKVINFGDDNR